MKKKEDEEEEEEEEKKKKRRRWWLELERRMLKEPPVNPRAYISRYPKLDPIEGQK